MVAFEASAKSAQALEASIAFNAFGPLVRLQNVALGETAALRVLDALPEGATAVRAASLGQLRSRKDGCTAAEVLS